MMASRHLVRTLVHSTHRPKPFAIARLAVALLMAWLAGGLVGLHGGASGEQRVARAPTTFDLEEATLADLQERMASGRDSARSLAEKYLARIEAMDRGGPSLRAIIELNPDALAIADRLDVERKRGQLRGPLHGVPVVIKDNIASADRMLTTAGSLALVSAGPARQDAFLVTRLRQAGAVLLAKTNLSEWANFRSTHSSSGWSARGGQTRNPYALDRSPSGSSSGSGVAVSANLASVAVGTETDGSIVSPSSTNGIVGIKPTIGLISRSGIVPIARSQDTAGPMARSVADAALLLGVLAGPDPEDDATVSRPEAPSDYKPFLQRDGLRGARIGVVRNRFFGNNAAVDRLAETAIRDMKAAGAVIVDPALIPTLGQFDDSEFEVLLFEFKADLSRFLAWFGPRVAVRSVRDVIAFNQAKAADELKYFGQEILAMADAKPDLTSEPYKRALEMNRRLSRTEGIDAVMTRFNLDALVAPTGGPAWLIDLVNGDSQMAPSPSTIAAVAGYPHITVPMGFYRGLPLGISFFGRAWSEPTLLKLAYAYEQATRHRRPPRFASSAELTGP